MSFQCDRRLYLSRDKSRVCEEGDPDAGWLFANKGGAISPADVAAFGLEWADGKVVLPRSAADAAPAPKAAKKPEDKAAKKSADKATARPPDKAAG